MIFNNPFKGKFNDWLLTSQSDDRHTLAEGDNYITLWFWDFGPSMWGSINGGDVKELPWLTRLRLKSEAKREVYSRLKRRAYKSTKNILSYFEQGAVKEKDPLEK